MQISGLNAASSLSDSDVLAMEISGVTYKVTGATLKAAVLAKLGGDPVTVAHGGTGATDAGTAKVNLGLQSAGQAVNIYQPDGTGQVLGLLSNVNNENSTLDGKRILMLLQDSGLRMFNFTDGTNVWQLSVPVAVAQGGTGMTSNPAMKTNLSTEDTDTVFKASPRPGVTGTLPISHGGTGQALSAAPSMKVDLSTESAGSPFVSTPRPGVTGTLPVNHGGTGGTTGSAACANLGAFHVSNLSGITDVNNLSLIGVAFLNGGSCANLPSTGAGAFYFCLLFGTVQLALAFSPTGISKIYARGYTNSQWYNWKSVDLA